MILLFSSSKWLCCELKYLKVSLLRFLALKSTITSLFKISRKAMNKRTFFNLKNILDQSWHATELFLQHAFLQNNYHRQLKTHYLSHYLSLWTHYNVCLAIRNLRSNRTSHWLRPGFDRHQQVMKLIRKWRSCFFRVKLVSGMILFCWYAIS